MATRENFVPRTKGGSGLPPHPECSTRQPFAASAGHRGLTVSNKIGGKLSIRVALSGKIIPWIPPWERVHWARVPQHPVN